MATNLPIHSQPIPLPVDDIKVQRHSPLRNFWELWKRFARKIGDFQARVLLILFYFVVLGPFALAVRWASDPLAIKAGAPRGWRLRDDVDSAPTERVGRQF
jgi:hypothetical protein